MSNYTEMLEESREYIEQQQYVKGLRVLDEVNKADEPEIHFLRSRAYFGIERKKRALKHAKLAFETAAESTTYSGWYAFVLYHLGKSEELKAVVPSIQLEEENSIFGLYLLVKQGLDRGEIEESQALFDAYNVYESTNAMIEELDLLLRIEKEDAFVGLLDKIDASTHLAEEKKAALKMKLYLKQGQIVEAQKVYNQIVQNNPTYYELSKFTQQLEQAKKSQQKRQNNQPKKTQKKSTAQPVENEEEKSLRESLNHLDRLIGLSNVKEEIKKIVSYVSYNKERNKVMGLEGQNKQSYHFALYGNPGTGKTTAARILVDIFYTLGVIPENKLTEVDRSDLVGQYIGSATAMTQEVVQKALGGVLFVDEAYALYRAGASENDFGQEAIDVLIKAMEDHRDELIVIFAGYTEEMQVFLKSNPGLADRINLHINFLDYNDEELEEIAHLIAKDNHYSLTDEGLMAFKKRISQEQVSDSFSNARTVRNLMEEAIREKSYRHIENPSDQVDFTHLEAVDFGVDIENLFNDDVDDLLAELDGFIGLEQVKEKITSLIHYVVAEKKRNENNLTLSSMNINMLFLGNPGTGKTSIARLLGKILSSIGFLKKGHLVEVTREDLVGQYVGHTGPKTLEKIKEAYGGILFVDEAYSLASGSENDFGKEAISTLVKEMEDNRDKLVVIMAGYSREMAEMLQVNSGLKSRMPYSIEFHDYGPEEMVEIFLKVVKENNFEIDEQAKEVARRKFEEMLATKDDTFGNGRVARNLFEQVKMRQSSRIVQTNLTEDLNVILAEDLAF